MDGIDGTDGASFTGGTVSALVVTSTGTSIDAHGDVAAAGALTTNIGLLKSGGGIAGPLRVESNYDLSFVSDADGNSPDPWFRWYRGPASGGNVTARLTQTGNHFVDGAYFGGGADLAEYYPTGDDSLSAQHGALVAIDPARAAHVQLARRGVAELLLGVVSTRPGVVLGNGEVEGAQPELLAAEELARADGNLALATALRSEWTAAQERRTDRVLVALAGRVPLRVEPSGGAIAPGDRLGLGLLPGAAARWNGAGPVVAIALEAWGSASADGETVLAFVSLERGAPATSSALQPADVAGSGMILRGALQCVVEAPGATTQSQPMLTFYGDPGSRWWIAARGEGSFTIALAQPAAQDVGFGYLLQR